MMGCQESEGGDVCKHIANSIHYTVETSTVLNSNDTPMKEKRKTLYVDVRLLLSVGFENSLHILDTSSFSDIGKSISQSVACLLEKAMATRSSTLA